MKKRLTILFNNRKPAYLIYAMAFFLCMLPAGLQALNLTARPDNFFVGPGEIGLFNILRNDDPGDCTLTALKVTIISPPSHALLCTVNAANQIRYRAVNGYTGTDQLTYQIECNGIVSTANVYIHINNMPDNITPDVCHIPPPPFEFKIKQKWQALPSYEITSPLVGDLDGDGFPEIVSLGMRTAYNLDRITIFDGRTGAPLDSVMVTIMPSYTAVCTPFVLVDSDRNGRGEIIVAMVDGKIASYEAGIVSGKLKMNLKWQTTAPGNHSVVTSTGKYCMPAPLVADFDGDGVPELVIHNQIYNARTGAWLGETENISTANIGSRSGTGSCQVLGDMDGDGLPELVAGGKVYKITINGTKTVATSTILFQNTTIGDGFTSIADLDLDGNLDVVVTNRNGDKPTLYIWNPRNNGTSGTILFQKDFPKLNSNGDVSPTGDTRIGVPFIGDVDNLLVSGKKYPEVCVTTRYRVTAFSYNPTGTPKFTQKWQFTTTDESGSTGITLFDFNQDGAGEMVYRDETTIRILDGSGSNVIEKAQFECFSFTGIEYPVVADIDGTGAAKICASCAATQWSGTVGGGGTRPTGQPPHYLRVFESGTSPWAPARKVWNQYAYNPVVINSDLTVPIYPISPATTFYESDGVTVNRPYNNFLQQGTDLNDEGAMLYLGPDLEFSPAYRSKMLYDQANNRLEVTIYVHNKVEENAGAAFVGPLQIDTYVYERSTGTYTLMSSTSESINIGVDETKTITYYINGYSGLAFPPDYDNWVIVLNGKDNSPGEPTFYKGSVECNWWNNFNANISFSNAERTICEGVTETVTIEPGPGVYLYRWYEWDQVSGSGKGLHVNTGDSYNVTKNANLTQHYLIDVYTSDGLIKLNSVPDTVFVWLTPDSLIWTGGAGTADWHNYNNWKNPNDPMGVYYRANIPRKCTDVLIPDMLSIYPDLDAPTNYTYYNKSECANIWFEHGGEVKQNNVLDYDSAYVYLALESDRWNMITVPLQYHYPGDYYLTDPNPFKDSLFVYTRLFSQTNPETGKYVEADWTGEFNNPEFKMPAGQGLSAWLWDKRTNLVVTDTLLFPKHDLTYQMYNEKGNPVQVPRLTPRTQGLGANDHEHRFIYEPVINSFGEFPLQVMAANANKLVLVGNPFMAHLDFKAFFALNGPSGGNWIKNYYQVMDETGNYISYNASTGVSTGTPPLNQYIAPLQSFLVESRVSFSQLYADVYMMQNRPGEKLRSSQSTQAEQSILSLELTDVSTGQQNRALLILNPESDNGYDETDIPKTLPILNRKGTILPIPASIFTRSTDGIALDVNQIPSLEEGLSIPVVIRSDKKGTYRLKLNLMSGFPTGQRMYLVDLFENKEYDLHSDVWVEFEKPTSSELLESRFYLTFKKMVTGIESPVNTIPGIEAYINGNTLRVFTTDNSNLEEVDLYDLQGRQVASDKNINKSEFTAPVQSNQFYIVRARSITTSRSVKVYGKAF